MCTKRTIVVGLLSLASISTSIFANDDVWDFNRSQNLPATNSSNTTQKNSLLNSDLFIGAELGRSSMNLNNSSNISVNNGTGLSGSLGQDLYQFISKPKGFMTSAVIGLRKKANSKVIDFLSLALRYRYLKSISLNGDILQNSLPEYNNYSTNIGLSSHVLSVLAKLNFSKWQYFSPYLTANIGMAINRTSNYQDTAKSGVSPSRVSPAFADSSKHQLSYGVGVGIDAFISSRLTLGLGYEFQSLGNFSTGVGQAGWSSQKLNFGKAKLNTLLFSLNYLLQEM